MFSDKDFIGIAKWVVIAFALAIILEFTLNRQVEEVNVDSTGEVENRTDISRVEKRERYLDRNSVAIDNGAITISCAGLTLPHDYMEYLRTACPTRPSLSNRIRVFLRPESGIHDILDTISGCTVDRAEIELYLANEGDIIVIEHSDSHIQLIGGEDIMIPGGDEFIRLRRSHGIWVSVYQPDGIAYMHHIRSYPNPYYSLLYSDEVADCLRDTIERWHGRPTMMTEPAPRTPTAEDEHRYREACEFDLGIRR